MPEECEEIRSIQCTDVGIEGLMHSIALQFHAVRRPHNAEVCFFVYPVSHSKLLQRFQWS
jgi:hypothetical protein